MTLSAREPRAWSEFGVDRHGWVASGVFQVGGANYQCEFRAEPELRRFLDFLLWSPAPPATSRLYLHQSVAPVRAEHHLSHLRFHFDPEHLVAAAVMLLIDRTNDDELLAWMTRGVAAAGHEDAVLTHDTSNAAERRFPPEAFVTAGQLKELVAQWAFGEVLPPPVVDWERVPHDEVGWL